VPDDALKNELKSQVASGQIVVVAGTGVSIMACGDQKIEGFPVARWDGLRPAALASMESRPGR
jgi:hypothetical protein